MPFDGTKLDETTQVLLRAKEVLLRDGWCINVLTNEMGHHCINGALRVAVGGGDLGPVLDQLARHIPDDYPKMNTEGVDWGCTASWCTTATYNNYQSSVEPILELLDKAIASG